MLGLRAKFDAMADAAVALVMWVSALAVGIWFGTVVFMWVLR